MIQLLSIHLQIRSLRLSDSEGPVFVTEFGGGGAGIRPQVYGVKSWGQGPAYYTKVQHSLLRKGAPLFILATPVL